jgi:hypothetical protein
MKIKIVYQGYKNQNIVLYWQLFLKMIMDVAKILARIEARKPKTVRQIQVEACRKIRYLGMEIKNPYMSGIRPIFDMFSTREFDYMLEVTAEMREKLKVSRMVRYSAYPNKYDKAVAVLDKMSETHGMPIFWIHPQSAAKRLKCFKGAKNLKLNKIKNIYGE